ncbi:hypothetical protein EBL29_21425 [Salmonella enterica subsp. enterica serovar Cerro]|nr:hypothetical protein [Salmonella enterica subsp. enterica serovar Cerro]
MKTFKGTPGPWKWTADVVNEGNMLLGENGRTVFDGDNIIQGLSNDEGWGARIGGTHTDVESEANAQLIAAAPELLQALQFIINDCSRMIPKCAEDKAIAAINKALGE